MNEEDNKTYLLKSQYNDKLSNSKDIIKGSIEQGTFLDTSFINGLRRYAISQINTLAFEYSHTELVKPFITINHNDSNMNNDFIGHRIGLLHVNIHYIKILLLITKILNGHTNELNKYIEMKDSKEILKHLKTNLKLSDNNNIKIINEINFNINIEGDSEGINVTTDLINILLPIENDIINIEKYKSKILEKLKNYVKLIEIYNGDKFQGLDDLLDNIILYIFGENTNGEYYYSLLCKLKHKEKLICNFKLNVGNGLTHSRWTVVCPCTYKFVLDNELGNKILKQKIEENELLNKQILLKFNNPKLKELLEEKYKEDINKYDQINVIEIDSGLFENTLIETQFKNIINEKDKLINNFNKCDKMRYYAGKEEYNCYKKQFLFNIESVGFYPSEKILHKTFKLLKKDIVNFISLLISILENQTDLPVSNENVVIEESSKIQHGIDISYVNGNHGLGNIISSYIYYLCNKKDDSLEYIAYKMVHPLKNTLVITMGFDNSDNIKQKCLLILKKLNDCFNNYELKNFIE